MCVMELGRGYLDFVKYSLKLKFYIKCGKYVLLWKFFF